MQQVTGQSYQEMPTLRERQQQFELDLFAGGNRNRKQKTINTKQLIQKGDIKGEIQQLKQETKSPEEDSELSNEGTTRLQTIKFQYLYDTKQSHPIKEFKPTKDELKAASITPSFVLEVTWPRVVQFYHPSSPHCQDFHQTYVNLARSVRRRSSRLPVEFHAVNCGVYMEVCSQGFQIKSVPSFLGLKIGSIEGQQLSLPGDDEGKLTSKAKISLDINEKVEYISDVLEFALDPVKEQSTAFASKVVNNAQFSEALTFEKRLNVGHSGQSLTEQVFQDATSSFFATLSSSIYSKQLPNDPLSPKDSRTLAEFVDLIRWAYPPETKVHTLADELKTEFSSITSNEEELLKLLSRHADLGGGVTWSERCSGSSDPYSCSFWSLLHIISIGVAERHASVVGYSGRVSVEHAGQSISAFVDAFYIGCDSCRKSWMELYDAACCAIHNGELVTSSKEQWTQLSVWIWEVHNEINTRIQRHKEPIPLLWPSTEECPTCWLGTRKDSFDEAALYQHLKSIYWTSGHHNNRLIMIDRWSKTKRALSMKRLRDRMASHELSFFGALMRFLFIVILLRAAIKLWSKRNYRPQRMKKRHETSCRGREDGEHVYETTRSLSLTSKRSGRPGNLSKRVSSYNLGKASTSSFEPRNTNANMRYQSAHRLKSDTRYTRQSILHL